LRAVGEFGAGFHLHSSTCERAPPARRPGEADWIGRPALERCRTTPTARTTSWRPLPFTGMAAI